MDHIPGESIHQEALAIAKVATFVGPHAGEPSLEGAHATYVVSRHLLGHRDATRARHGPLGGEAGEGEVGMHEQGERRRWRPVAARRRAPGAADGAQPSAVFDAREAADHDPEDICRDVRPRPPLRFAPCVKSCILRGISSSTLPARPPPTTWAREGCKQEERGVGPEVDAGGKGSAGTRRLENMIVSCAIRDSKFARFVLDLSFFGFPLHSEFTERTVSAGREVAC
jgi:hypothetical protein